MFNYIYNDDQEPHIDVIELKKALGLNGEFKLSNKSRIERLIKQLYNDNKIALLHWYLEDKDLTLVTPEDAIIIFEKYIEIPHTHHSGVLAQQAINKLKADILYREGKYKEALEVIGDKDPDKTLHDIQNHVNTDIVMEPKTDICLELEFPNVAEQVHVYKRGDYCYLDILEILKYIGYTTDGHNLFRTYRESFIKREADKLDIQWDSKDHTVDIWKVPQWMTNCFEYISQQPQNHIVSHRRKQIYILYKYVCKRLQDMIYEEAREKEEQNMESNDYINEEEEEEEEISVPFDVNENDEYDIITQDLVNLKRIADIHQQVFDLTDQDAIKIAVRYYQIKEKKDFSYLVEK